ncbi:MAG: efflux RND transporter permease subunit, partial [Verrucomicrobiota bacterium]
GDAASVRIRDIFEIQRAYEDPPDTLSHFNGERVLCIAASMIDGGVVSKIGEEIEERLQTIQNTLPIGLEIERMFYQPIYVDQSIADFLVNLGQAFFFVMLVMFLFSGWRLAVIVGVLVPSVCLFAFAFMPVFDVELEMMSIAALIIALGILVDNAVVVCEQILNRLNEGMERAKAVTDSIKALMIPLLAGSGTTIAAFAVIATAEGGAAEFTFSLFAVVTLSLLGSWLLSITIIALFCYSFLQPLKRDTLVGRLVTASLGPYEALLRFMIRLRWAYPILIVLLTIVALAGFGKVPSIFFPPNERGQFIIDFELPQGKNIYETEEGVKKLEDWLLTEHGDKVATIASWIGEGGPRWYLSLSPESPNRNYALLSVLTKVEDPEVVQELISRVSEFALANLPDARVTPKALENGPPVGDPIQIRISGPDMDTLYGLRDRISAEVKLVEGLYDVRDDWGAWVKQVVVDPDPVRASRLGITTETIADALSQHYSGTTASYYREGEDSIPIVLRSQGDYRTHLERIRDLPIYNAETGAIPISQVADVRIEFSPGAIERRDTVRTMTIQGRVRGRFASEALAEIQPKVAALMNSADWPNGYGIEYAGEQADSAEAQGQIAAAMPGPMMCLCLILIAQFNSIRRFLIIIFTIPPMMIGVVPGLLLTGSSFGFMTLLGLLALMGIIVNNAILMLDETNLQLESGKLLMDAVVDAAKSRLRPILMTTFTTIIGLTPLALGGGGMWSSMANAMIFGLAFATALTLLLCPILFFLFFRRTYD